MSRLASPTGIRVLLLTFLLLQVLSAQEQRAQITPAATPQATAQSVSSASQVVPALPVPRLIKIGGIAKDAAGQPRTGTVGITFAIYASETGGTPLWTETQNIELDAHGHYSTLLGSSQSQGMPLDLFATGEPRWLGTTVELPGEVEQQRVLLVSVPYALKASDADTVGGLPASAFALSPSGPASGAQAASGTGSKANESGAKSQFTSSGTANYIPVFTDNSGDIANSIIYQGNNAIGIGVTNPNNARVVIAGSFAAPTYGSILNASNNVDTDFYIEETAPGGTPPYTQFGPGEPSNLALAVGGSPVIWMQNDAEAFVGTTSSQNDQFSSVQIDTLADSEDPVYDAIGAYGVSVAAGSNLPGGAGVYAVAGTGDTTNDTADGVGGIFYGGDATFGGDGIDAFAGSSGYAGYFTGNIGATGTITGGLVIAGIDHPLDPANKYLVHAAVESSEMKNIYDGTVTTDGEGNANVQLPEWFEALNTDFRYQLTVIGQFAQAIVSSEVANHQFGIKTDKPNVKVSWQITGVRQDAYAKAHPLVIEQAKNARERGYYIHPELYGASKHQGIEWARHPEMMKRMEKRPATQAAAAKRAAAVREEAKMFSSHRALNAASNVTKK